MNFDPSLWLAAAPARFGREAPEATGNAETRSAAEGPAAFAALLRGAAQTDATPESTPAGTSAPPAVAGDDSSVQESPTEMFATQVDGVEATATGAETDQQELLRQQRRDDQYQYRAALGSPLAGVLRAMDPSSPALQPPSTQSGVDPAGATLADRLPGLSVDDSEATRGRFLSDRLSQRETTPDGLQADGADRLPSPVVPGVAMASADSSEQRSALRTGVTQPALAAAGGPSTESSRALSSVQERTIAGLAAADEQGIGAGPLQPRAAQTEPLRVTAAGTLRVNPGPDPRSYEATAANAMSADARTAGVRVGEAGSYEARFNEANSDQLRPTEPRPGDARSNEAFAREARVTAAVAADTIAPESRNAQTRTTDFAIDRANTIAETARTLRGESPSPARRPNAGLMSVDAPWRTLGMTQPVPGEIQSPPGFRPTSGFTELAPATASPLDLLGAIDAAPATDAESDTGASPVEFRVADTRGGSNRTGTATLAMDLGDPTKNAERLAQQIQQSLINGAQTLRLSLRPQALGGLELNLSQSAGGELNVQIAAQSAQTRDLIDFHLPRLRASLEDAGIRLGEISIQAGSSDSTGQQSAARQQGSNQQGADTAAGAQASTHPLSSSSSERETHQSVSLSYDPNRVDAFA